MGWSPYVKYMVIGSQDNRKVAAKSPFKIQRELVKILGAEPHSVTKQCSGDLMVELRNKEQETKLEEVKSFMDIPVTVGPHKCLNTSKDAIKHSDFPDCTEEEFVDEFPDVIHARRIHVRKRDVRIPTNTIVLTFDCPNPPPSLRAGYLTVPVRPREVSQAIINKLVKMDTENIIEWNIRSVNSSLEDLKLLLSKINVPILPLLGCKLGEEQLSLRGYTLIRSDCPAV